MRKQRNEKNDGGNFKFQGEIRANLFLDISWQKSMKKTWIKEIFKVWSFSQLTILSTLNPTQF